MKSFALALIVFLGFFLGPCWLWADDALKPGEAEVYPTPTALGIEISYAGDDNQNGSASFVWRKHNAKKWNNGVDMTMDRSARKIWASIWPLEQGDQIEIKITYADPDQPNLPVATVQGVVKKLILENEGGRPFYVSPHGMDTNPGTREKPFKTLAFASRQVKPGDTVLALSGVYPEGDLFRGLKGSPEKPIVFAAAPGAKPVLDSSRVIAQGEKEWRRLEENVYAIEVDFYHQPSGYVAQDGKRMFRYKSLSELRKDPWKTKRAWYYDASAKTLYVRTGSEKSASQHRYNLSQHAYGLWLSGTDHVVIRGFTLRYYGEAAVRISEGALGNILFENVIHIVPCGIFLKSIGTRDNVIWNNHIYEEGLVDFSWGAIKASGYARQGIYCTKAGRGLSICHNKIHGWFDCVAVESWKNPTKLEYNRDCDVMFNELYNAGDDAIEVDGGGVNMRLHGNRIRNCLVAISLAPIERGPVYCTRNNATFLGIMFKFNVNGCTSLGWTYCYHNSGYCLLTGVDGGTAISFPPKIPCSNKVIKNNIIICNEWSVRAGKTGYVLDGNCYFNVPGRPPRRFQWSGQAYRTIQAFRKATGQEANGIYADPKFQATPQIGKFVMKDFLGFCLSDSPLVKDTTTSDFRLQSGSPCIDRGVLLKGINDSYKGEGPDIGAFER